MVCALLFREEVKEISGLSPTGFDGARFCRLYQVLELG